jgi:hypothetical protein
VECPVKKCAVRVNRIDIANLKSLDVCHEKGRRGEAIERFKNYFCEDHKIFITPSTFIYSDYADNCLWRNQADMALLEKVLGKKRVKAQLYHDNSEDAITWNVFRFLEKNSLLEGLLSDIAETPQKQAKIIYWSYCQEEESDWRLLNKAREEFGEETARGSEPDIIIKTDRALFFIEAKLTAGNETSDKNKSSKKYETGGSNWFSQIFTSDYRTATITAKKYELTRFWLLGTWMAEKTGVDFYLINLVPESKEKEIEELFGRHIKQSQNRRFFRKTWESVCKYILAQHQTADKDRMIKFLKNKTIGYKSRDRKSVV